jgi:hypothetical protein
MRFGERIEQYLSGRQWIFIAVAITFFVFFYCFDPRSALTFAKLAGVFLASIVWSEPMISRWVSLLGCSRTVASWISTMISSGVIVATVWKFSRYSRDMVIASTPRWLRPVVRLLLPKIPKEQMDLVTCLVLYGVIFSIAVIPFGTWPSILLILASSLYRPPAFGLVLIANGLKNFGWGKYLHDPMPELYAIFVLGTIMFALDCIDRGRQKKLAQEGRPE